MLVATGVEHSGTGLLSRILRTSGETVLHRAMPHVEDGDLVWWDRRAHPEARFVVITRDERCRHASSLDRGQTATEATMRYHRAMGILASIPGAVWVSLEALVANPATQLLNLSKALGLALDLPEPLYDPNMRFLLRAAA